MARMIVNATVGTSPQPNFGGAVEPNKELTAQAALLVTAKADVVAGDTAAGTAKADALAVQVANVAVTPVESAVAVLEADGATPTQAHVVALRGVWNTLSAACTAHNAASNTVATTATAAKAATAAAVTAANLVTLTAAQGAVSPDVVLIVNGSTVLTKNKFKQIIDSLYRLVADGSSLLT